MSQMNQQKTDAEAVNSLVGIAEPLQDSINKATNGIDKKLSSLQKSWFDCANTQEKSNNIQNKLMKKQEKVHNLNLEVSNIID